jgi:hypothetical protein
MAAASLNQTNCTARADKFASNRLFPIRYWCYLYVRQDLTDAPCHPLVKLGSFGGLASLRAAHPTGGEAKG